MPDQQPLFIQSYTCSLNWAFTLGRDHSLDLSSRKKPDALSLCDGVGGGWLTKLACKHGFMERGAF